MHIYTAVSTFSYSNGARQTNHLYPFTCPNQAMKFIEMAKANPKNTDDWEIVTEIIQSPQDAYENYAACIKD
jgi:hypothetical protein